MKVQPISIGGWASNSYLLSDDAGTCAVLLDPTVSPEQLSRMSRKGPRVRCVILTHGHFDHMTALAAWQQAGVPVLVGRHDAAALSDPTLNCSLYLLGQGAAYDPPTGVLCEGDTVPLGDEELTVLATPGHTAGGICLLCDDSLICGDTLFANGGIGRYDLPGADFDMLMASIKRILSLPEDTRLYPGHGPASTVRDERRFHSLK